MALLVEHGVGDVGLVVVAREQNGGAEINGTAPELGEHRALDVEALDGFGVRRDLDGRDHLIADELDAIAFRRIERDLFRGAVEIAGRAVPALAFPLIVVHPDDVAVGAVEFGVDVDEACT